MFYFFLQITCHREDKKIEEFFRIELFGKGKNHMGQHIRFWYLHVSHVHKSLFQRHMLTYPTGIFF